MTGEKKKRMELHITHEDGREPVPAHVVFDFSGSEDPDITDIAWILTARLQSAPTDQVWVRSTSWRTEQILRYLRLDHLFRQYPEGDDLMN